MYFILQNAHEVREEMICGLKSIKNRDSFTPRDVHYEVVNGYICKNSIQLLYYTELKYASTAAIGWNSVLANKAK